MTDGQYRIERNKLLVILGNQRELIGMSTAKLYTTNKDNHSWLYSDLEGFLCFILDHAAKTRYFVMFDSINYEKLFQFELYDNFTQSWQSLSNDFYCFEFGNGLFGLKFKDQNEANMMNICVKKFNETFCEMLYESFAKMGNIKKTETVDPYLILREKFCDGKNLYDENYIEDGLEICKPKYFDLINNITYDKEKKEFSIGKIPDHLKNVFKHVGLKKKHFKNRQLALNILKNVMETIDILNSKGQTLRNDIPTFETRSTLQSENSIKERSVTLASYSKKTIQENIIERGEEVVNILTIKQENVNEIKSIEEVVKIEENIPEILKELKNEVEVKLIPETKPIEQSVSKLIPTPPKLPSKIPTAPKLPPIKPANTTTLPNNTNPPLTSTSTQDNQSEESLPSNLTTPVPSMFDEMKKVQLKKSENKAVTPTPTPLTKSNNTIMLSLVEAIKQRRIDLTKNDVDSDGDESDWSD